MKKFALISILALTAARPATAEPNVNVNTNANPNANAADRAVVQYLVSDSTAEVALCRLAMEKSQNAAVKAFAQRMIADHTNAVAQSVAFARAQNLGNLDTAPAEEGVIEVNHLARYSGHMFDENFLQHNQEDHQADIEAIRHAAEISQNPAVKSFLNQQLPLLENHLLLVEQTMDQVAQSE